MTKIITDSKILVTGGAGFIGSNLVEVLLAQNNNVVCLDNFSTGFRKNIDIHQKDKRFTLIDGDIRNFNTCREAVKGVEYVFHQAALGSVPRSVKDPITTNEVNISGFLNMLTAARDEKVKRFVYAASSSTYGDHPDLPKYEDVIGNPLSPYAITKYVNELYAGIFSDMYDIDVVGLRYFNVFGRRQDPNGAYAAVIPLFVKAMMSGEEIIINGDGTHSRDFTYIDNIIQINQLAALTDNPDAINTVYNAAFGERITLTGLFEHLKKIMLKYNKEIRDIQPVFGPEREGDIKHSLASIDKARRLLNYNPEYSVREGLELAVDWYFNNL